MNIRETGQPASPGQARLLPPADFGECLLFHRGFTLIEMLVVIGVIGILAGLLVGAMPALKGKQIRNRVKAELTALETAIEAYKAKQGFYPPENPSVNGHTLPPLFYELTGTRAEGDPPTYRSIFAPDHTVAQNQVKAMFGGIEGFMNSGREQNETVNFYKNLNPAKVKDWTANNITVKMLIVPHRGPTNALPINPWHYTTSKATNNPSTYDLWAEIQIGRKTEIIGNWKE